MKIHLQWVLPACGLLCLSLARKDNAPAGNLPEDTTRNQAAFISLTGAAPETKSYALADLLSLLALKQRAGVELGITRQGRAVTAWYFPGISEKKALIIGGMHGSELSSIEAARTLVEKLLRQEAATYYSVIIIPSLFPDNAAAALKEPDQTGTVLNIGRYTHKSAVDPNRQMPSPGSDYEEGLFLDHLNRPIEQENRWLLQLIRLYRPDRIASIHAIRSPDHGGVYADPRTDEQGMALGFESDSSLALNMAALIARQGGNVNGNQLQGIPTALYYKDPAPAAAGEKQKRNTTGAALKGQRGSGISLGTWGTTAIRNETDSSQNRKAMRVITVEIPGAKRSADYHTEPQREHSRRQIAAFVNALYDIFLGPYGEEEPVCGVIASSSGFLSDPFYI